MQLVFIAVESFCAEVVVVTFEHMLEHLLVLGDEEVVSSLQMRDDFLSERLCLAEVGLALVETGTFDGTPRSRSQ